MPTAYFKADTLSTEMKDELKASLSKKGVTLTDSILSDIEISVNVKSNIENHSIIYDEIRSFLKAAFPEPTKQKCLVEINTAFMNHFISALRKNPSFIREKDSHTDEYYQEVVQDVVMSYSLYPYDYNSDWSDDKKRDFVETFANVAAAYLDGDYDKKIETKEEATPDITELTYPAQTASVRIDHLPEELRNTFCRVASASDKKFKPSMLQNLSLQVVADWDKMRGFTMQECQRIVGDIRNMLYTLTSYQYVVSCGDLSASFKEDVHDAMRRDIRFSKDNIDRYMNILDKYIDFRICIDEWPENMPLMDAFSTYVINAVKHLADKMTGKSADKVCDADAPEEVTKPDCRLIKRSDKIIAVNSVVSTHLEVKCQEINREVIRFAEDMVPDDATIDSIQSIPSSMSKGIDYPVLIVKYTKSRSEEEEE